MAWKGAWERAVPTYGETAFTSEASSLRVGTSKRWMQLSYLVLPFLSKRSQSVFSKKRL